MEPARARVAAVTQQVIETTMPLRYRADMVQLGTRPAFGDLLRGWRQRRHLSQLQLASEAQMSARHLSFVETGRARPSRELVLHLAEQLDVPLRERNALLLAAGFAPVFPEHDLEAPAMDQAREALGRLLEAHEPYPAMVVDRHWNLVLANRAVGLMSELIAPDLLAPPLNVGRVSLHPDGLAPHIVNFAEYAAHFVGRLRRQVELTADPILIELFEEVCSYPNVELTPEGMGDEHGVVLPLRVRTPEGELSMFTTIATFGAPLDVTLSELAIEAFYPADEFTADVLRRRA